MNSIKYTGFIFLHISLYLSSISAQTAGTGFSLIQEIEVGSASTGGINDLLTGIDLDGDGNGEIIIQIGQSSNAKTKIYEWDGTDSYDEIWSVSLAVNNSSSDQIQRLLAVDDTDNDGNLELFVASSTTTSANARVYCFEMASGALSSSNPSTTSKGPDGSNGYFQANTRIRAIVTGNADNDTYGELYVGNAGNSTSLEVWEASGDDSWSSITLTGSEDDVGDGIMDMAPPTDLDNDGNDDDIAICEEQGALNVIDFSTLADPSEKTVNNKNDTGSNTTGRVMTYNLDNTGSAEIIISNNGDDGILIYEWVSGSSAYDRDKTDAVLFSIGADINGLGLSDYDNDGAGEIFYTYEDDIKYYEYASSSGDFNASSDFSSSSDMITGLSNNAFLFRPSANISTTLLDGDQYRDFVIGTDGSATSGRGEIFIVESGTKSIIPKVSISGNSGFRMMSSPVAGTVYDDILDPLWIQGMTNGDVTNGTANVWTFNVSDQSWTALSNLNTASQTAGEGFLVYVFADTDNDGDDDLPVSLAVTGTVNSSSATVGSIADTKWALTGNPFASTIDWDLVTQTAVTTSCYVWDDATSAYKTWNGSTGSLTDGLIAPYQGFWVQGSGGTGSLTIETADKSSTAGTFYKTMNDSTGSISFTVTSGNNSDQTFVSFMNNGEVGMDNSDAYKLLPMSPSERVLGISYAENNGLDINNLPFAHDGIIDIPFDVMYLTLDEDYNFVTNENEVTMNWDLSSLPETIIGLTLTNNVTNESTDLLQTDELSFTTQSKESFPAYGSGGVNIYPEVGESQFTLTVAYNALSTNDESTFPTEYALHQAYPNPFNPSTTISFDVPVEASAIGGATSLQIFNIKGQLVETLINKHMEPGTHKLQWNPTNISSGIYIVQLKAGEKVFNQKITYIK
ncbi:MAG: T9SS type A sorting domain-containing protein [Candidatus Marinimicrobia bacterium]|nr:T9SS type A sorting domain-containing protein [Candidatus Neomarinimicrobiota bacterium]